MIAGIMQPYFFPYIGYFQLMKAVDVFVLYDDAQYMKGGWINRNRILTNDAVSWITVPVRRASVSLAINQRYYLLYPDVIQRAKRQINAAYNRSGHYAKLFPIITELLWFEDANVARFNANLLTKLAREFGINTRFMTSSEIEKPDHLKGEAKIIDLCQRIGAEQYVNLVGGCALYNQDNFLSAGIELSFLRTDVPHEPLASGPEHLSIIDGMMRHGLDQLRTRMDRYTLLDQDEALTDQRRPST